MFKEVKKLLVLYKEKDELALNQLKNLIDTNDDIDGEHFVGTEDGTVKVVGWNEKTWLDNKKAGNTGDLDDRILFLGDIKGVDKHLIPSINKKFDKHGVSYGFSGKQSFISINGSKLRKKEDYDAFIEDLKKICDAETVNKKKKLALDDKNKIVFNDKEKKGFIEVLASGVLNPLGTAATMTIYAFEDKKTVRIQQLLYGVVSFYLNHLDDFMKR